MNRFTVHDSRFTIPVVSIVEGGCYQGGWRARSVAGKTDARLWRRVLRRLRGQR